MSALTYRMGHDPIDPAFGGIRDRDRWAIPWLEGDDFLANPQLWVARTRKDAADALAYGCAGLMGLQWRTRILGPTVAALAQAGWDQSPWNPSPGKLLPNTPPESASPADAAPVVTYGRGVPRALPIDDFYADWAAALFGEEAAGEVASVFSRIDGRVPHSIVRACPAGAIRPISQPWQEVAKHYAFLEHGAGFWSPAIAGPGKQLAAVLGGPLPEDAQPPRDYTGRTRLIVPTVRTSVARGEQLKLKAVVLSSARPEAVTLHWREMGRGEFRQVPLTHVARGVYTVCVPAAAADLEYYVEAALPGESLSRFPATAPDLNQTLVLMPERQ